MRRRGQSTTEVALILPFVVGLIVLTLQGGLLISDQVNLEHFAYEGAQWAIANRATATVDPSNALGTGSIAKHVLSLMCGGSTTAPSSTGTKYCTAPPSGVPGLSVSVSRSATPTSLVAPGPAPTGAALGAKTCNPYTLSVTPASATISQNGGVASFVVQASATGPPGHNPSVLLSYSSTPAISLQVPPVFVPTQLAIGQSSTLSLQAGASTVAQTYSIVVSGTDDCTNAPPSTPATPVSLTVTGSGGASPSPSPSPSVKVGITGVLPGLICVNISNPIQINGFGFEAGATISTGPFGALAATWNSANQLTVTLPPITTAGSLNLTVNNPDLTTATLNSAYSVATTCSSPSASPLPSPPSTCCDGGSGVAGPTTLTDPTKSWTPGQWVGAVVTMGGSTATVISSTATTLTLAGWTNGVPLAGTYQVQFPGLSGGNAACSGGAGQFQAIITITWAEPLAIPLFAPAGTPPSFTLKAVQVAFCQ